MIGRVIREMRKFVAATNEKLLPTFQFDVVLAVKELKSEAYGAEIRRYLCRLQDRDVSIGQVFTCLAALEDGGLISPLDDNKDDRLARRRKVYSVTPAGVAAFDRSVSAAKAFCGQPNTVATGSTV